MSFPRQEYWSGLPFPSSNDLSNPGIKPVSPTLGHSGYTQLSKFLEDIPAIVLNKESSQITVSLRDEKNEEDSTIQDIREIVRRRGSRGIALATLGLEIRRRHRGFNVKLYGYSQLYRFIESIPDLEVIGDRADRKVVYRAKN